MPQANVVLVARVDDPVLLLTCATFSTVVQVETVEGDTNEVIVDCALEIAPPMQDWTKT